MCLIIEAKVGLAIKFLPITEKGNRVHIKYLIQGLNKRENCGFLMSGLRFFHINLRRNEKQKYTSWDNSYFFLW